MRKYFNVLFLSVVLLGGLLGSASAMPQYSVSVAMFEEDEFMFATNPNPTRLILVFGKKPDELEQVFERHYDAYRE